MIFVRIVSRYDVTSELCKNNQFGCFLLLLSSPHPCPYYLDVVFYFIFRNAHVNYGIFPFSLSLSLGGGCCCWAAAYMVDSVSRAR